MDSIVSSLKQVVQTRKQDQNDISTIDVIKQEMMEKLRKQNSIKEKILKNAKRENTIKPDVIPVINVVPNLKLSPIVFEKSKTEIEARESNTISK